MNMDGRETYYKLLQEVKDEVVVMEHVEKALGRSVEALKKRDLSLGHQIM